MIYQHEVRGADRAITDAIDTQVQGQQRNDGDDDCGAAGVLVPAGHRPANGPEDLSTPGNDQGPGSGLTS